MIKIRQAFNEISKRVNNKLTKFKTLGKPKVEAGIPDKGKKGEEKLRVRRGYPLEYYEGEYLTSAQAAQNIEMTYEYIRHNKLAFLGLGVMFAATTLSQSANAEEIPGIPNPNPGKNITAEVPEGPKRPYRPPFIVLPPPADVEKSTLPFYLKTVIVVSFVFGGFYIFLMNNRITITIEAGRFFLNIEEID